MSDAARCLDPSFLPETLFLGVSSSLQNRKWVSRASRAEQGIAECLVREHDVPLYLAHVLATRGVTPENIDDTLQPSLRKLMPDPSTLTDMDRLVDRLARAIANRERIALFGDYDVDGACSVALMLRYLRLVGHDALFHIPDRLTEGYGPNAAALERFKNQGASLVVTLDCGTTSFEAFDDAKKHNLEILVIDHHLADEKIPETQGLVNPNRQDDLSGLGYLCAAGVTFMVLVALNRALRQHGFFDAKKSEPDLMSLIDLVALATVSDVVPLQHLNRAFVHRGLERIRARENIGLRALQDAARMNGPADTYHLGFLLGPRINAGGRIGDAGLGTKLLTTNDEAEALQIAQTLDRLNQERQVIEQVALEEAKQQAEHMITQNPETAVLVVQGENWHPGIVGLLAARLKEQFQRPAFAIALDDQKGTGSGRSITGVDLGSAVRTAVAENIVRKGGGHKMAAGVTVDVAQIETFRDFMQQRCKEDVDQARLDRSLHIDGLMNAATLNVDLATTLQKAGPFGSGCPEPVFAFPDLKLLYADIVAEKHLRLTFQAADGTKLKAMAFRAADSDFGNALIKARGQNLHLAATITIDNWQGRQSASLRAVDVAPVLA
ncbi:MAG: single-stranded-DNA-specific exonuclease RecJ [Pseudomonadota bacterium]